MKELQIIVAGAPASGKSTMMLWLEQVLMDAGFSVELNLETELLDYGTEANFRKRLAEHVTKREEAIMNNSKIILSTKQTQRGSSR